MTNKEELKEFMLKEIIIIQDIIKRMASNSFMIKGWTISLVVVSLLLRGSKNQVLIAFIPIIFFWFLDAYFLLQERLYRKLYNWVIKNRMESEDYLFDLNVDRFKDKKQSKFKIMFKIIFSKTIVCFYGSIFITTLLYLFLIS